MCCLKKISFFVFLNFFLIFTASVFGAPKVLNYQGTLQDNNGNPVTGTKKMSFKIYDVVSQGTALWSLVDKDVNVLNGVFSVTLDGESDNPFPDDLFSKDKLYLGISVDGGPEFVDRKRLASVPYALNASSASATAGVPSGVIVMWHGSADSIPEGWALCDGKDDITPDLRDKFVLGGGGSMPATGGTLKHSHAESAHQHGISNSDLNHNHGVHGHTHNFSGKTSTENDDTKIDKDGSNHAANDDHTHTFSGTTDGGTAHNTNYASEQGFNLNHNHGGLTQPGGGKTDEAENIPPYYALCFIMKL